MTEEWLPNSARTTCSLFTFNAVNGYSFTHRIETVQLYGTIIKCMPTCRLIVMIREYNILIAYGQSLCTILWKTGWHNGLTQIKIISKNNHVNPNHKTIWKGGLPNSLELNVPYNLFNNSSNSTHQHSIIS